MPLMTSIARPSALKLGYGGGDEPLSDRDFLQNDELARVATVDCVFARCSPPPLPSSSTTTTVTSTPTNGGVPRFTTTIVSSSSSSAAATATATATATTRPASEPCFLFNNDSGNGSDLTDTDDDDSPLSKSTSCITSPKADQEQITTRNRSVSWGDISGQGLEDSICFWQDDAPCRCGTRSRRSSTETRARTPELTDMPLSHSDMLRQLCGQGVQLESTMVRWPLVFLSLRVLNISFEKNVFVRVTFDSWKSFSDIPASYVETAQDQLTVSFQSTLKVPTTPLSEEAEFAICCQMNGREYWDNNNGKNFHMQFCHQHQSVLNAPRTVAPVTVAATACCSPLPASPATPLKPCLRQSSVSGGSGTPVPPDASPARFALC